jgi:hypothetical protein
MAIRPDTVTAGALAMRVARLLKVARVKLLCPDATELGPHDALLTNCAGFKVGMALQRFVCPAWTGTLEIEGGDMAEITVSRDGAWAVGLVWSITMHVICWSTADGTVAWSRKMDRSDTNVCIWRNFVVTTECARLPSAAFAAAFAAAPAVACSISMWMLGTGEHVGTAIVDLKPLKLLPTRDVLHCVTTERTEYNALHVLDLRPGHVPCVAVHDTGVRLFQDFFDAPLAVEPNGVADLTATSKTYNIFRTTAARNTVPSPRLPVNNVNTRDIRVSRSGRFIAGSESRGLFVCRASAPYTRIPCDFTTTACHHVVGWGTNDVLFILYTLMRTLKRLVYKELDMGGGAAFVLDKEWSLEDLLAGDPAVHCIILKTMRLHCVDAHRMLLTYDEESMECGARILRLS